MRQNKEAVRRAGAPRKQRVDVPKSERIRLTEAILAGHMSRKDVTELLDLSPGTVGVWLSRYRQERQAVPVPDLPSEASESERTSALKSALDQANLKVEALTLLIENAERELGVDLRKKLGAKP